MCWPQATSRSCTSARVKLTNQSSLSAVMITSQIGSFIRDHSGHASVAGAGHNLLALRLVGSTLLRKSRASLLDVPGQRVDMLPTQGLLDQGAHDRDVLGVGGKRVRRHHPAAFG